MWKSADDLSADDDFKNADLNDLAIAYMFLLETGRRDSAQFLKSAENDLVESFMDLRKPVVERLYRDLVSDPVAPWQTWNSPLRQMLVAWGKKGEVYQYWVKQQQPQVAQLYPAPLPDARKGEWREVPGEFWAQEADSKRQHATKTTAQQIASMDEYNRRYRQFYNLPPWAQVDYDPYLDFKIRMTLTGKLRDAGPAGTAFALTAMLRGGSVDDVMAAVDMGNSLDGVVSTVPGRGSASSAALNSPVTHLDGLEPSIKGVPPEHEASAGLPLQPFQLKPAYSRPGAPKPIYRHTVHGGGMEDILANQRMLATDSKAAAGSSGAVRAYNGPFKRPVAPGPHPHIEFTTRQTPNFRPFFGIPGSEWPMEEGQYLDIEIINVIHPDGTVEPFDATAGKPQLKLVPGTPSVSKPPGMRAPTPPTPNILPPIPIPPRPQASAAAPAPARKLTMVEFRVLDVLTGEWQSVSGIYLQTRIPDAQLSAILEGLVVEGYAEKQPDPKVPGATLYRGSPQWVQFKQFNSR